MSARASERRPSPAGEQRGWPQGFASDPADRAALLVLLAVPSLTARRLLALASVHATAGRCLEALRRGRVGTPLERAAAAAGDAEDAAGRLLAARGRLVAAGDEEYPGSLLDLYDPPAGLFVVGRRLDQDPTKVAVVGARNCSPTGRDVAGALGQALGHHGAVVVSGGARGIDAAAHRGALAAGAPTVVVLGCGVDVTYPRQNRGLLRTASTRGSIVSEYPPGTPARPFHFPARNRIVAGMSRAVVVVEGGDGSGSLITAEHALDLGREVYAVPGAVTNPLATVPLSLIRDGAGVVRHPGDLLDELGLAAGEGWRRWDVAVTASGEGPGSAGGAMTTEEAVVWAALTAPSSVDSLSRSSNRSPRDVLRALGSLEMRGLVRQVGGRYERTVTTASR